MTIPEASQKWSYAQGTIFSYIQQGRIPGCYKLFRPGKRWEWFIPDDAKKPMPKKPGFPPRPKLERAPGAKFPVGMSKVPQKDPGHLTNEDIADFIADHASDMSYGELSKALQMPSSRIREIYDQLHEAYGV